MASCSTSFSSKLARVSLREQIQNAASFTSQDCWYSPLFRLVMLFWFWFAPPLELWIYIWIHLKPLQNEVWGLRILKPSRPMSCHCPANCTHITSASSWAWQLDFLHSWTDVRQVPWIPQREDQRFLLAKYRKGCLFELNWSTWWSSPHTLLQELQHPDSDSRLDQSGWGPEPSIRFRSLKSAIPNEANWKSKEQAQISSLPLPYKIYQNLTKHVAYHSVMSSLLLNLICHAPKLSVLSHGVPKSPLQLPESWPYSLSHWTSMKIPPDKPLSTSSLCSVPLESILL